jgi:hypothetical protein
MEGKITQQFYAPGPQGTISGTMSSEQWGRQGMLFTLLTNYGKARKGSGYSKSI